MTVTVTAGVIGVTCASGTSGVIGAGHLTGASDGDPGLDGATQLRRCADRPQLRLALGM